MLPGRRNPDPHRVRRPGSLQLTADGLGHDDARVERPEHCFGKPCVRGHRIWVSLILGFLASGETGEEILESYPQLTHDDILACIAYGTGNTTLRFP